ncbi:hypothetical protein HPB50_020852 [Hyalomma asiaticum]|uniref:Uncharacterized protein n=1 Tax=Hyalomma asiaticum TaxID=266040 RepID=A0ACB7RVL3_HYAAI|nr:hypothetical protein HPB50_020852 [Hyalomma asiaticum]
MFHDTSTGDLLMKNCSASCLITNDPLLVEHSDAVVFHVLNMTIDSLPSRRHMWQKWVFYLMESPPHTRFIHFNHTRRMFNWTMTYRRDSDVYVPYGRLLPRDASAACPNRDLKALWESKNKTAVWVVSNCFTDGGREDFVAELRKYIDGDVYGRCGDYECPKTREDSCYAELQRTYFFTRLLSKTLCVRITSPRNFTQHLGTTLYRWCSAVQITAK